MVIATFCEEFTKTLFYCSIIASPLEVKGQIIWSGPLSEEIEGGTLQNWSNKINSPSIVSTIHNPQKLIVILWLVVRLLANNGVNFEVNHNYGDALSKSILFFEGQRSGKLPSSQRLKWRKDSALHDGKDVGVNAGDNVKFNFPMAFTTTMLAWSVIEYGKFMGSDLVHPTEAVKWGTDYFLISTSIKNKVFVQVGDPYSDHRCCQRPEDMDTNRTAYVVTDKNPGSEVAGEIAAALASSSIVFKTSDPAYSWQLLERAIQVFEFADNYQGSYNPSLGKWDCPFYCDFSGYYFNSGELDENKLDVDVARYVGKGGDCSLSDVIDELLWAAAWLYKASNQQKYWDYVVNNIHLISENNYTICEFGWDDKHAGIYVLMANELLKKGASDKDHFRTTADQFACTILPESPIKIKRITFSPGGLLFKRMGSNTQNPTALSFLLLTYAHYLDQANKVVQCGNITAQPQDFVRFAKGQVDYILGNNPMQMSYMVGYGNKYPKKIHHRGSTLPSVDQHPQHLACHDGDTYFDSNNPNPNELTGAVVGGPFPNDTYPDSRKLFVQSEPCTYINAPLVGVLAYFT
ncbi:hypothetical protein AQUCO_00100802v1 [Aquilegia coerulea]|uniref:Endoglucanase n=1 Tax=Aquilegia coerulea TaxID=218851 RepID=A0A2G5FC18_AQUCA|nr:hypothetical protein AQUCO_00100802v1 [Aquilegia coerulea]